MRNLKRGPMAVAFGNEKRSQTVKRISAFLAALCTTLVLGTTVAAQPAEARSVTYNLDIPSQSLNDALQALALASQHKLLYSSELVDGKSSPAIKGQFTTEQAVKALLSGSNLAYEVTSDGLVLIRAAGEAASSKTTVSGPTSMSIDPAGSSALRLAQDSSAQTQAQPENTRTTKNTESKSRSPSDDVGQAKLEEIVVTAQRREETLNRVPISITALSQRTMDDLHIQKLSDLATIVPGLFVFEAGGATQDYSSIAVRGIRSPSNAPTTQIYIDETPIAIRQFQQLANSMSPQPYIFDLDRAEVLRGPQGTLFGASAMGGAIRFITPQPNLQSSNGFAKAETGFTKGGAPSYEVGAAYGMPLVTGEAAFRVSAWYQRTGGFIDREDYNTGQIVERNANSSEAYVIRPAFTWAPSEELTITPSLFFQRRTSQNPSAYWLDHLPNPGDGTHYWGGTDQPLTDDLKVSSLAIKYTVGGLSLQSDTSYLDRKLTANTDTSQINQVFVTGTTAFIPGLGPFASAATDNSVTQAWQQEFRVSSQDPSLRLNWTAGAFYRHSVQGLQQLWRPDLTPLTEVVYGKTSLETFGTPNYIYSGEALSAYANVNATEVSEAAFGDVTVNVTSRLKANAGVRIEHQTVTGQHQVLGGPLNGVADKTLADQKATPITPRATLTYQYTDNDMVYLSAAKGFRPGGGNSASVNNTLCRDSLRALGISSAPDSFKSDSLWSYEIGAKDLIFEKRLSIEASVYYIDWSDIQTDLSLPSCFTGFTGNRGKAISRGFDLQVAAVVTDGLKVRALVGYTDTYYPDASYGAPVNGVAPLLNGAGEKLSALNGVLPWTAAANAEYARGIGSLWSEAQAYVRVDYRWLSAAHRENPNSSAFDPRYIPDPSYSVLNFRLGVTHGGLDLSAYINNVTNANPRLNVGYFADLNFAAAIPPRGAGITAWFRF